MIETQLAQLAASLPSSESGGIPGQAEPTREHVSANPPDGVSHLGGCVHLTMYTSNPRPMGRITSLA
jgi:hypothetical protein